MPWHGLGGGEAGRPPWSLPRGAQSTSVSAPAACGGGSCHTPCPLAPHRPLPTPGRLLGTMAGRRGTAAPASSMGRNTSLWDVAAHRRDGGRDGTGAIQGSPATALIRLLWLFPPALFAPLPFPAASPAWILLAPHRLSAGGAPGLGLAAQRTWPAAVFWRAAPAGGWTVSTYKWLPPALQPQNPISGRGVQSIRRLLLAGATGLSLARLRIRACSRCFPGREEFAVAQPSTGPEYERGAHPLPTPVLKAFSGACRSSQCGCAHWLERCMARPSPASTTCPISSYHPGSREQRCAPCSGEGSRAVASLVGGRLQWVTRSGWGETITSQSVCVCVLKCVYI